MLVALLIGQISLAQADSRNFQHDNSGNITQCSVTIGNSAPAITNYTYDALNRLLTESGPSKTQTITYDGDGNRLSDGAGSYTYSTTSNRMLTRLGATVTTDPAGHVTADGTGRTFTYNDPGRLATVSKNGVLLATYTYDYMGLRTRKVTTASAPQGAQTIHYDYDLQGNLLDEIDVTTGTSIPIRTYFWNPDSATPIGYADYKPSRKVFYFAVDHLKTPRAVMDDTGKVVWRWESDAFGSTPANEDPDKDGVKVTMNLRFPGQYYDQESGLHYNWHRYYDPAIGRYTQADPIGMRGGINGFTYVEGNPLSDIDPLGLAGARNGPSRIRGGVGSSAQEINEAINYANVNRSIEQIRTYDPNFKYATVAPPGYRYNRQDVEYLNDLLRQYQASNECTANGLPRPSINYGTTPNGVPFTRHYGTETGPVRNLPGSLIDHIISNGNATSGRNNSTIYYDPVNNATVVVGSGGIMSVHKQ